MLPMKSRYPSGISREWRKPSKPAKSGATSCPGSRQWKQRSLAPPWISRCISQSIKGFRFTELQPTTRQMPPRYARSISAKKYRYTPTELAEKLKLNTNQAKTLRQMLNIEGDPAMCHIFEFGKSKHPCYSDQALALMK